MLIYCTHNTPRLQYIVDFFAEQLPGTGWRITTNAADFISYDGPKINYSNQVLSTNSLRILPQGLLFASDILPQQITCSKQGGIKVFFQTESDTGFDIFAATFYLISRYEEYLPHHKDKHGRYAPENSLAFKEGFLQKPLVNIWMDFFRNFLLRYFSQLQFTPPTFQYRFTYDVDMAWSFLHKRPLRNLGGMTKDFTRFDFKNVHQRLAVLKGSQADPYYSFDWLNALHKQYNLPIVYFFLLAEKASEKDKNISPHKPALQRLIKNISGKYQIGLHPSWQSGDDPLLLNKEKQVLQQISGQQIIRSRQHYLRFQLPRTYEQLVDIGIQEEYSMGYASINGFRASVASPFYWFNLRTNSATPLKVYPFCFMDATCIYYNNITIEQAFEQLQQLYQETKNVSGYFCTLWHNNTFDTSAAGKKWQALYAGFLKEMFHP